MQEQHVWKIELRPDPGGVPASVHLILSPLYDMYVAKLVFDQWGYSSDAAADLLARIAALADLHAPTSPARHPLPE
jgi:hypothetical protein